MSKETGVSFEPSSTEFFGLKRQERRGVRSFLEKRLLKVLNQFPFSSEETSDLPVLKINYGSGADRVMVPGFSKALPVLALEKIMDGVLVSRASFRDRYKYGPIKKTAVYLVGENHQKGYKTYDFLIKLKGGREYVATKGIEYSSYVEGGKIADRKESVHYTVSLREDDLMTQLALDEDASDNFGLGNF